jgi:hypothetical protein
VSLKGTEKIITTERLDIAGVEFGRLLVLSTETGLTRREAYRVRVRCSCGTEFIMTGKRLLRGEHMCRRCEYNFAARYGVEPEREAVTLDAIRDAIAERDSLGHGLAY